MADGSGWPVAYRRARGGGFQPPPSLPPLNIPRKAPVEMPEFEPDRANGPGTPMPTKFGPEHPKHPDYVPPRGAGKVAGRALARFIMRRALGPLGTALDLWDLYNALQNLLRRYQSPAWVPAMPGWKLVRDCGRSPQDGPTQLSSGVCSALVFTAAGSLPSVVDPWAGHGTTYYMQNMDFFQGATWDWQLAQHWERVTPGAVPLSKPASAPLPRHDNPNRTHMPPGPKPGAPDPKPLPAPQVSPAPRPAVGVMIHMPANDQRGPFSAPSVRGPYQGFIIRNRVRVFEPEEPPVVRRPPDKPRPPEKGMKERKYRLTGVAMHVGRVVRWSMNAVTETSDVVDALYWALPAGVRARSGMALREGGYAVGARPEIAKASLLQNRIKTVYDNLDKVDGGKFFANLIKNEIADRVAGGIGKRLRSANRANPYLRNRPVGLQTGPAM